MSEVLKPKPLKKHLPGTKLLIKLGKDREKEREKRAEEKRKKMLESIDPVAVAEAVEHILADLA